MINPEKRRQLAAIMFTDIAGYTAMMGDDEDKAIELLHNNRNLQKPLIDHHGGKWLKEMGDGVLASFDSAYRAVKCAIDIQQRANEDLKNKIRIGIHLGDVTIEEDDVFGDGVNIASRLESIADPGSIYISEAIHQAVRANSKITTQYLGELQLKNVENKIGTYVILEEGLIIPSRRKIKQLSKTKSFFQSALFYLFLISSLLFGTWAVWNEFKTEEEHIQSLAVLPFVNYSGDESKTALIAGMHDELITELGQLGAIRVTGRQSSLRYANSEKTIQEIASELNVDALVEASVLTAGDSIRVQLKLIRAFSEEEQLWSQTFNTDMKNILNLYSLVIKNIADEIQLNLSSDIRAQLSQSRTVNPDAYEAYLNGKFQMGFLTSEGQKSAMDYFNKSIEFDPNYAPAYAGLMGVWAFSKQMDFVSTEEANPRMEEYLSQAMKLDSQNAEIYYWEGIKNVWTDFDYMGGERSFKHCIEINPNHSLAWAYYSHLLMILKKPNEMRSTMKRALEIDPNNLLIQVLATVELMVQSKYDSCLVKLNHLQTIIPNNPLIMMDLFICYAEKGKYDLAIIELKKLLSQIADETVVEAMDNEYNISGFEKALNVAADVWVARSDTTFASAQQVTMLYAYASNTNKVLDWLEKGYQRMDPDIPYIGVTPYLRPYHNEARLIGIMQKMNLPLGELEPSMSGNRR